MIASEAIQFIERLGQGKLGTGEFSEAKEPGNPFGVCSVYKALFRTQQSQIVSATDDCIDRSYGFAICS